MNCIVYVNRFRTKTRRFFRGDLHGIIYDGLKTRFEIRVKRRSFFRLSTFADIQTM